MAIYLDGMEIESHEIEYGVEITDSDGEKWVVARDNRDQAVALQQELGGVVVAMHHFDTAWAVAP